MFSIVISYRVSEYISLLRDVSSNELGKRTVEKWYFKLLAYPLWFFVFLFKSVKEGKCHFVFSEKGFERTSNSGSSQIEWSNIGKVVDMENVFLLVGKNEGMAPLPKRCLSKEQITLIKKWAGDKLASEL